MAESRGLIAESFKVRFEIFFSTNYWRALTHTSDVLFIVSREQLWRYDALVRELKLRGFSSTILFSPHPNRLSAADHPPKVMGKYNVPVVTSKFFRFFGTFKLAKYRYVVFNLPYLLPEFPYRLNFLPRETLFYTPYTFSFLLDPPESNFGKASIRLAKVACISKSQYRNLLEGTWGFKMAPEDMSICGYPTGYEESHESAQSENSKILLWAPHWTSFLNDRNEISDFEDWVSSIRNVQTSFHFAVRIRPHGLFYEEYARVRKKLSVETAGYIDELLENGNWSQRGIRDCFDQTVTLIHNGGSFIAEHLVTGKKQIFWKKGSKIVERLDGTGERLFELCHNVNQGSELLELFQIHSSKANSTLFKLSKKEIALLSELGIQKNFEQTLLDFMQIK